VLIDDGNHFEIDLEIVEDVLSSANNVELKHYYTKQLYIGAN
jgi:hypothetical protein